jgi:DNA-directed RNA polymerase subunit omega
MARINSEKAVNQIGNRFDLILVASKRVRELKAGHRPKVATKTGALLTALTEIEEGLITKDYLKRIR